MVMPGDNVSMEIELITPIAMEKGLRFAIREGGRTVGAGTITDIVVAGAVGEYPLALTRTSNSRSAWGNAFGILVRHSQKATVSYNASWDNCIGVFLLADGQAGGSGQTAVLNNAVAANSRVCPQFSPHFLPILGGGGIVLAGSQHNVVLRNVVTDNRGDTLFSGGIVLIATPRANEDGTFDASTHNLVFLNSLRGNQPADIVTDEASSPTLIEGHRCSTSVPGGRSGS
jgi:hypothetical protein